MEIIADVIKKQEGLLPDNSPIYIYKFVDLAGNEFNNYKFISFTDNTKTKAILQDLSVTA